VKENGEVFEEVGLTVPPPSSLMVTFVALPPKVLSETVTAVVPHVLPDVLLSVTVGGSVHCPKAVAEIYKRKITEGKAFIKIDSLIFLFLGEKTLFISDVFYLTGDHIKLFISFKFMYELNIHTVYANIQKYLLSAKYKD
jgi:hypothetical protein